MNTRWAIVLAGVTVIAGVLLLYPRVNVAGSGNADSAARSSAVTPPPSRQERPVRVEHDLLIVQPTPARRTAPRRPPGALVKAEAPAATSPRAAPAVRRQAHSGVAARAGRMLLGDGRYRPEPFPKPAGK